MSRSDKFNSQVNWRAAMSALTIVFAMAVVKAPAVQAQSYKVLYTFTGGSDGGHPGRLTMDAAGNLYGSALLGGQEGGDCQFGGADGCGAVFRMKRSAYGWIFTPLYAFQGGADGARPGPVVFGPDGALYGTTLGGGSCQEYQYGCGTIFKLTPPPAVCKTALCPWVKTTLYAFAGGNDGWNYGWDAIGPLTFGPDGSMYGATWYGGSHSQGVVYKLTPSNGGWTESVIHAFAPGGEDGYNPSDGVIFDQAGNLYGVTNQGGTYSGGTVYELSPSGYGWTESILYSFTDAGIYPPEGGLIFDPSGNLYGTTTTSPGEYGGGAVFKLTPSYGSWTISVLSVFSGFPGGGPKASLTIDASGALYGTTWGDFPEGTVFKLTPQNGGWTETDLYGFRDGADGGLPVSNVLFDSSGNLYGTASSYGSDNWGVVWEITP
jgi:uncharacterized repeat protein (TIGR03803 family)